MDQALKLIESLIEEFQLHEQEWASPNELKSSAWVKRMWCKYSSIDTYSSVAQTHEWRLADPETRWAVTEKVHGANFAIAFNGTEFVAAKRTSILHESAKFFPGWQDVVEAEKPHIRRAFELLKQRDGDIEVMIVYGELFGGLYSHTDKRYRPRLGTKHVQKGIYYSPDLRFFAFDIRTNYTETQRSKGRRDDTRKSMRIEFAQSLEIFEKCGFLFCEPLFVGSFKQCLTFLDVETFQTTIPKKLGLPPPIDTNNGSVLPNIAEGVVIRKLRGGHQLIKLKSKAFLEISGHVPRIKKAKPGMSAVELDEKEMRQQGADRHGLKEEVFHFVARCITEQRYDAVRSKVGVLDARNVRQIIGMMVGDVYQELRTNKFEQISALDKNARKFLTKYVEFCVVRFFQPKIKDL